MSLFHSHLSFHSSLTCCRRGTCCLTGRLKTPRQAPVQSKTSGMSFVSIRSSGSSWSASSPARLLSFNCALLVMVGGVWPGDAAPGPAGRHICDFIGCRPAHGILQRLARSEIENMVARALQSITLPVKMISCQSARPRPARPACR